MYKIPRSHPWPPTLDLATVRETLLYMKDDLRRVPNLAKAAQALETAIAEIEKAERTSKPVSYSPIVARFLPRSRSN